MNSGIKNAWCYKCAVGSSSSGAKLYVGKCDAGHSFFNNGKEGHIDQYITVETKTLKQIFDENNIQRCNFLKIDCEDCEFDVLFNTSKDYLNRIEKISMEFHDNVSNYTHIDLRKFLEEAGFVVEIDKFNYSPFGYLRALNTSFKRNYIYGNLVK